MSTLAKHSGHQLDSCQTLLLNLPTNSKCEQPKRNLSKSLTLACHGRPPPSAGRQQWVPTQENAPTPRPMAQALSTRGVPSTMQFTSMNWWTPIAPRCSTPVTPIGRSRPGCAVCDIPTPRRLARSIVVSHGVQDVLGDPVAQGQVEVPPKADALAIAHACVLLLQQQHQGLPDTPRWQYCRTTRSSTKQHNGTIHVYTDHAAV